MQACRINLKIRCENAEKEREYDSGSVDLPVTKKR